MYLMVSHIPVYIDGNRYYTDISWQRDLVLARDWLAKPFHGLRLLAPSLSLDAAGAEVPQLSPIGHDDEIKVVPSFDPRCRAREFWLKQRHQWMDDVRRELRQSKLIHTSAGHIYRPLAFLAHEAGVRAKAVTVLVGPDMDPHVTVPGGVKGRVYCLIFDLLMRRAVERADLALLKEGLVYDRYARCGTNTKAFCHSMHTKRDVIDEAQLERRLATLRVDRPLRAVYAGQFVSRKGVRDAIAAICAARRQGASIEYHLFGAGPERESLQHQANDMGVGDLVRFHGFIEYGPKFIAQLATYDLLLFLPTEEDTPRMLYDAMAAGLPLVGSRIPFLNHRVKNDHMGVLVDVGDSLAAGNCLKHLNQEPERLKALSRAARTGGERHSIEEWYRCRAEWTQEAWDRRLANRRAT
jgi:glycosyltransferase involved in cell wall biosynthesis